MRRSVPVELAYLFPDFLHVSDICVPRCIPNANCEVEDMGLFAEVRFFQLHDLSIPFELSERYIQLLVLQEAEEREHYMQDAQLARKDTERQVRRSRRDACEHLQ